MRAMQPPIFDFFALALPWGLSFDRYYPYAGMAEQEGWITDDGSAWGVVLYSPTDRAFGVLVVRRRRDDVWAITCEQSGYETFATAKGTVLFELKEGQPLEALPSGVSRRPKLFGSAGKKRSKLFMLLTTPSRHRAAWVLRHLYLCLPKPGAHFAQQFQGEHIHTRMWELLLFASFKEQGCFVSQNYPSPDFHLKRRGGLSAWVEAVTANPPNEARYEHVNAPLAPIPAESQERCMGAAAVRFAKTLKSKIDRQYHRFEHVRNEPFAIAIADFQAAGSMRWTREALITYLYGVYATEQVVDGAPVAVGIPVDRLLGEQDIPAGLFHNPLNSGISAIIFSNACTIAKFSRVIATMTREEGGYARTRSGQFFDRTPGALRAVPFSLNLNSDEYRNLWPQQYEPWSAELEIFHNPLAERPMPREMLPEAQHWVVKDGEMIAQAFYETSILWSETLVEDLSTKRDPDEDRDHEPGV
ncbi:hypothetical protein NPS49_05800 [Pseudomonas putida]|uniref:hypothetical protein n=1 Tax=Pseudomonas putida TaxID=303 RepID=UPI00236491D2|nr:hypothetical protein [Pseudomonas putida]MDD2067834.1 hypothetical protein [Pseudomonas putida]HDS1738281.1 hypothetical protein [Pseudomonas putida]